MSAKDPAVAVAGTTASLAASTRADRARWLTAVADRLDRNTDELVRIADAETHLGSERLSGEVQRTTGQLRLFAEVAIEGSYLEAIVDDACADAVAPRPELRRMLRPIGPVAVFSASNFPFAFSVAGGDTAAALAAGCPVVVKSHSGHPELSWKVAGIVAEALADAGAPPHAFALVEGREEGLRLVRSPAIRAVAFTGSLAGARGLMAAIAERPDPIPFFGELGSPNPVVITPGAARSRAAEIASGLVGSFTLGGGQFCTKPGVVFVPRGFDRSSGLADLVAARPGAPLLTDRIADAFAPSVARLAAVPGVRLVAGTPTPNAAPAPVVLATDVSELLAHTDVLLEECFGPMTLLIEYDALDDVERALAVIEGSLTATIHADADEDVTTLVDTATERVGRVLFDGWPTGVAVTWSQNHGGPWPATTGAHTSVGATAIRRFLRPIVYQQTPERYLPSDLRDRGLARIPHRRNGALVVPSLLTAEVEA